MHQPRTAIRNKSPSQPSDLLPVVKIGRPVSCGSVLIRIRSSSRRLGHSQVSIATTLTNAPTGISKNSLAIVATVTNTTPRAATSGM
jgi:hypothetical protein